MPAGQTAVRELRRRPFLFTIVVRRASPHVWQASVDTDDAEERTFARPTEEEAKVAAEAYATQWALEKANVVEEYEYDFSPLIEEKA